MKELEIFELIKNKIINLQKKKPIRIGINGIEGTGKTVFAKKLVSFLKDSAMNAIHVSIDDFHFNKEVRYNQGKESAKGYYEDSYDEKIFVEKVLKTSQLDKPNYITATHNLKTDQYLSLKPIQIDNKTILITDGAYLFKPIYLFHWDFKIYLKTDFKTAILRGIERDKDRLGGELATEKRYKERYHKASKIYLKEVIPEEKADIIIDNSDFGNLILIKNKDV